MTTVRTGAVLKSLQEQMASMTTARTLEMCLENLELNEPYYREGKSLRDLRDLKLGQGTDGVVIAAGPSLQHVDPVPILTENAYAGASIITESALSHCLRQGFVPTCAVSVDPHPLRIVRWFGDPDLDEKRMSDDDYFRRQEQDPSFADEKRKNDELLALMNEHGPSIRIVLGTTSSPDVVKRVHEIGMQVFWFNPMLDDPDTPDSVTMTIHRRNGFPSMNAGGNVGSACWMVAHAVLGKTRVAVTGMDFGYYADHPVEKTQYYPEAVDLVGIDRIGELFVDMYNPHTGEWYYTDPAYFWYRTAFLEMTEDSECDTYNCGGGGTLFGENINWSSLRDFLSEAA